MKQLLWMTMLALLGVGCGSVTWVNGVATSPDGKIVTVVGAEFSQGFGGPQATRPLRWTCLRNEAGLLSCQPDASELPRFDEDAPPPPVPPPAAAPPPAPAPTPKPQPVEPEPPTPTPPTEPPATAGCTDDSECKAPRVCRDGQCVSP